MRARIRSIGARLLVGCILPLAVAWARRQERCILREGRPLSPIEREDARHLGLSEPWIDAVRVRWVYPVPRFADRWIRLGHPPAGMALGSGIYLDETAVPQSGPPLRAILRHELVHVRQYEQMGGIRAFLRQYLFECLAVGYVNSPMECEANVGATTKTTEIAEGPREHH